MEKRTGNHSGFAAEKKYRKRRKRCVRKRLLDDPGRNKLVTEKLRKYWSRERIAGRPNVSGSELRVSYTTIYRAIHAGQLALSKNVCTTKAAGLPHTMRRRVATPRTPQGCRYTLPGGAAATFVDRRSGFLVACLLPNRKAKVLAQAQCAAFAAFPPSLLRSFTVDNGNEFFDYKDVEQRLGTKQFFADPGCPGQRGLNENINGLLRQYFPKKFDFSATSPHQLQAMVDALNARPRKRLGFRPPNDCFSRQRLLLSTR